MAKKTAVKTPPVRRRKRRKGKVGQDVMLRVQAKLDEVLDEMRVNFGELAEGVLGSGRLTQKRKERLADVLAILRYTSDLFSVYMVRTVKFKDDWRSDDLDVRVTFAELSKLLRQQKGVVWEGFEDMEPELAYKIFMDIALTAMQGMRRLELENDVDVEQVMGMQDALMTEDRYDEDEDEDDEDES